MSQLTIHEKSKLRGGVLQEQAIIRTFEEVSPFVRSIPVMDIGANDIYSWNRQATLPKASTRRYNENFGATSLGNIQEQVEGLVILGGDVRVDEILVDKHGPSVRSEHERAMATSIALSATRMAVNGSSQATNNAEFNGLRFRVDPVHEFPANLASPGTDAPLSLDALSKAIQEIPRATHIAMSPDMIRLVSNAAKSDLGGQIRVMKDEFGYTVTEYNGLPIVPIDYDEEGQRILDFDEPGFGGANNTTSIYVYRASTYDGVCMLQSGGIRVNDIGRMETEASYMTRMYWQVGMAAKSPNCLARIKGIQNAAVTK